MNSLKPIASLSLDLDNLWSYLKTHGDAGWESFPSYLDLVVPRVLGFLKERGLAITVFVVGQDAALDRNREALGAIAAAGHEIGNHSFHHEPWLHLYSEQQMEDEIARAEEHIERATGQQPRGFRGPGFSLSCATLRVLTRRGYLYDATTLPSYLGPLARAYYLMTAKLSAEDRQRRRALFGGVREGLRPLNPYRWQMEEGELTEVPVTTMPLLRVPFHVSYVLYLASVSPSLALAYFRTALLLCRLTQTQPSLLLHPLDFIGKDDTNALAFFPGMQMASGVKMELVGDVIRSFTTRFNVLTVREHARQVAQAAPLPLVRPRFRFA